MKLLINFCGHDGIISHYAGVGTIVRRYIEVIEHLLNEKNIDYHLNLFTLEFNKCSITFVEDRPGHDLRYAINSAKLKNELNWKCKYNFEEGMKETIKWYSSNQEWIKNIETGKYRNIKILK